jgi:hypothetical protein
LSLGPSGGEADDAFRCAQLTLLRIAAVARQRTK